MPAAGNCIKESVAAHLGIPASALPADLRRLCGRGLLYCDALNPHLIKHYGEMLERVPPDGPVNGDALVGVDHPIKGKLQGHCLLRRNGVTICDIAAGDPDHPGDSRWRITKVLRFRPMPRTPVPVDPELLERVMRQLQWAHGAAMEPGPPDSERAAQIREVVKALEKALNPE